jgi:hypothetical protein
MATPVANIQQAIDEIVTNLQGSPTTEFQTWFEGVFTEAGFDSLAVGTATFWAKENPDQRTVFDWVIPSLRAKREILDIGDSVESTNIEINVVLRTLLAVQASTAASRITQDQEDTVVEAYNAAF